jgi:cytochrome c biogenesis protein CcdA/thiol-disulfide isomerase/thioredoxin
MGMLLLLLFAFISGLVTIAAPCIWPLLPIVLAQSTRSGRRRPAGLAIGVAASFGILTLTLSLLARALHFDANILRYVAVFVIAVSGVVLLIPWMGAVLEGFVSPLTSRFGSFATAQDSGFSGGLTTGLALGVVWTPCAGPILATIAALGSAGTLSAKLVIVTTAYVTGAAIPLFGLAYGGQRLLGASRRLSPYLGRIQQAFGVVLLAMAVLIGTSYDTVLETRLLNAFPQFALTLNAFESSSPVTQGLASLKGQATNGTSTGNDLMNAEGLGISMPEFAGINQWLNTDAPLSRADLRGKVVLVDFWTYTCINCLRTLPNVTRWHDIYRGQGFVVIGVHTPEFAFEHNTNNVAQAIQRFGIHYPVAQDNDYDTWNAYNNQYWPAQYLFDASGKLRRAHFGEGEYDQMETAIQQLLAEAGHAVNRPITPTTDLDGSIAISPETYLGTEHLEYAVPAPYRNGKRTFALPTTVPLDHFALGGTWTPDDEQITAGDGATLRYHFQSDQVYLVLRPPEGQPGLIDVLLDGQPIGALQAGDDVTNGLVTVDSDRLYHLVDLRGKVEEHTLELRFRTPGTQVFAFTFGP